MDRVLRSYAHTAWTPADPLDGLDAEVRRAILLMPSTFRERWKLAPWTDRHQRRLAVADIVAERRLMYELTHQNVTKLAPSPVTPALAPPPPQDEVSSPYYRYRLTQHRATVAAMRDDRAIQDRFDIERVPEARADHEHRLARGQALLALEIERAKLDVRELDIMADRDFSSVAIAPLATRKPAQAKKKTKKHTPDR